MSTTNPASTNSKAESGKDAAAIGRIKQIIGPTVDIEFRADVAEVLGGIAILIDRGARNYA